MVYAVYTTESFQEQIKSLSDSEKRVIGKVYLQLKGNPYVGDQIRYRFFREKRIKEKRIYYLVYDNLASVLVVAFGGKKAQQETIEEIIKDFPEYRKYMEKLLKKSSS